jgi:hypothetical protein
MTANRRTASTTDAWAEHALSQLRYFRSLSLHEKFGAVEGMADVVRQINRMRERFADDYHTERVTRAEWDAAGGDDDS